MTTTTDKMVALARALREKELTIVDSDCLARSKLDFSEISLIEVDSYLATLHRKHRREDVVADPRFEGTAAGLGAYVGEVMRRKRPAEIEWASFDEMKAIVPEAARFVEDAPPFIREFNLMRGKQLAWPGAKVLKFVENGAVDSVAYFASVMLTDGPSIPDGQ